MRPTLVDAELNSTSTSVGRVQIMEMGVGEIVNRRATYLGASTTTQNFLRAVKPFGTAMIASVTETL